MIWLGLYLLIGLGVTLFVRRRVRRRGGSNMIIMDLITLVLWPLALGIMAVD